MEKALQIFLPLIGPVVDMFFRPIRRWWPEPLGGKVVTVAIQECQPTGDGGPIMYCPDLPVLHHAHPMAARGKLATAVVHWHPGEFGRALLYARKPGAESTHCGTTRTSPAPGGPPPNRLMERDVGRLTPNRLFIVDIHKHRYPNKALGDVRPPEYRWGYPIGLYLDPH